MLGLKFPFGLSRCVKDWAKLMRGCKLTPHYSIHRWYRYVLAASCPIELWLYWQTCRRLAASMIVVTSQSIVLVMGLRDAVSVGAKTYPNKVIVSLSIKLPITESSKASWLRSRWICWISRWTSVFTKFALESLGTLAAEANLSIRCILVSFGSTRRVGTVRLPGKAGTLTGKVSDPESLSFYVAFDTPGCLNDRYLTP